jgi:hypothetical protein
MVISNKTKGCIASSAPLRPDLRFFVGLAFAKARSYLHYRANK